MEKHETEEPLAQANVFIYPAVQNMPTRALGLGATLTTVYLQFEKEAEAALGLPPNVPLVWLAADRLPDKDGSGQCAVSPLAGL